MRPRSNSPGAFDATPQELVMTLLGAYLEDRETGTVWAGGLVRLLADLGFSEGAARIALSRLAAHNLLIKDKRGRHVHYALSDRARAVLAEGDRRIFSLGRAPSGSAAAGSGAGSNGTWTLLWHAIPDEQRRARDALTRRLRFLGFGSIQDGTWIAARDAQHDVSALLDQLGVREHAGLMRTEPADERDARTLARRAWDLDALELAYIGFVEEFSDAAAGDDSGDDREAFRTRTRLVHAFRSFPFRDPELPPELVEPPPHRAPAVRLFHQKYDDLEPAAQRHFDAATTP